MAELVKLHFTVPGDDFTRAGEAAGAVKGALKQLGLPPADIRRVSISLYEGEINMVIHGGGGEIDVAISPESVWMELRDEGPGIEDVALAMLEGWSTATEQVRNLGFGAGMGLPNIKRYSDAFTIDSKAGAGTTLRIRVDIQ